MSSEQHRGKAGRMSTRRVFPGTRRDGRTQTLSTRFDNCAPSGSRRCLTAATFPWHDFCFVTKRPPSDVSLRAPWRLKSAAHASAPSIFELKTLVERLDVRRKRQRDVAARRCAAWLICLRWSICLSGRAYAALPTAKPPKAAPAVTTVGRRPRCRSPRTSPR